MTSLQRTLKETGQRLPNNKYRPPFVGRVRTAVPVFASANNDESTDDDADECNTDSHSDSGH